LRTAGSLAVALGKRLVVENIRANRPRPGLRAQHKIALEALAAICAGQLSGAELDSTRIELIPGPVRAGEYHFDVGTAGSTSLVLQTVIPPLLLAEDVSRVSVRGGTHNPMAPPFEYLRDVFGPLVSATGAQLFFMMERAGFYPAGGGEVTVDVQGLGGSEPLIGLHLAERGELRYIEGLSAISEDLPAHIVERQAQQVIGRLRQRQLRGSVEQARWPTHSPGTAVFLRAVFGRTVAGFSALGQRGKPAEAVADEAIDALLAFLDGSGALDEHAADQVLTVLALTGEPSRFTTQRVSSHLLTNAEIVRQLTGRQVQVEGALGESGSVFVGGL
jgi:RNA 3'-terminal phosphate cyclase (ATP)